MSTIFSRTELLLKKDWMNNLKTKKVIVFGVGGVGGYVCEALARSGVYNIAIVDKDVVSESNINRQIIATTKTIGKYKVDVMEERILAINPEAKVEKFKMFFLPGDETINFNDYDYIVDCVDTVTAKISIITKAIENNKLIISAMGAGNKLDITKLKIADINQTSVDPLARVMRYELRKRGIKKLKVAYSTEEPIVVDEVIDPDSGKKIPGSNAFVPAAMGLLIASEIIKDLNK